MDNILVFGATGYIGTHLIPRLRDEEYPVRACSRSREVLEGRFWDGVEAVEADALDINSLEPALENIDSAFYLIHSRGSGKNFDLLDQTSASNFLAAAEKAGIKRIIFLNVLPPAGKESSFHASSRKISEILNSGSIPVTELRVGDIMGAGSVIFEVVRGLAYHQKIALAPRWMRSRIQPISLHDVIEYLARTLKTPETIGKRFDIVGPEIYTLQELVQQFALQVSRSPLIISIPFYIPSLSAYVLSLTAGIPINVGRPLIDGISRDHLVKYSPIRKLIPMNLQSIKTGLKDVQISENSAPIPARWAEGAITYRNYRPEFSYYAKKASAEAVTEVPIDNLWRQVKSIGGNNGWYYQNWMWDLRASLDLLVGGVGMRRGRRHPQDIRVGDTLDFYRVIAVNDNKNLTLGVEMKLPGAAIMEFELVPQGNGQTRLSTSAYFHPSGIWGYLYWYALVPVHLFIFKGVTNNIIKRALECDK